MALFLTLSGSIFHIGWFYLSHGGLFFTLDGSILLIAGMARKFPLDTHM